jgi:hypothetical protein
MANVLFVVHCLRLAFLGTAAGFSKLVQRYANAVFLCIRPARSDGRLADARPPPFTRSNGLIWPDDVE